LGKRFKASDLKKFKVASGKAGGSDLEAHLARDIKLYGLPAPVREYRLFAELVGHKLTGVRDRLRARGWKDYRYDFAWPEYNLLVEVNGGIYMTKGGHNTISGITRDYHKSFTAAELGWTVVSYAPSHVKSGEAAKSIYKLLLLKGWQSQLC